MNLARLEERRKKYQQKYGNNGFGLTLGQFVALNCSGWPTPNCPQGGRVQSIEVTLAGKRASGAKAQLGLENVAQLALGTWPTPMAGMPGAGNNDSSRKTEALTGWATPSSRDWKDSPGMAVVGVNPDGSLRNRMDQLPRQAVLAIGTPSISSLAETGKPGALNPAHSRWLMGFPPAWDACADTAMQSAPKRPPRSSPRSKIR